MPTLPPDILRIILQHFHKDAPTLKQCALVNQSWLHEAQPILFSTHPVCIDFLDVPQNPMLERRIREQGPHEFIQLMNESPHLRLLICIVKLHLANIAEDFEFEEELDESIVRSDCQRWLMTYLLSPLRDAGLRSISTLILHDRDPSYMKKIILDLPLDQSRMDPGLKMTLSSLACLDIGASMKTPSLMSLQCFLCSSFPQLRHLSLRTWPSIQDSSSSLDSMPPPNNLCLQRLDIGDNDYRESNGILMAWFSQTRTAGTLEHLTFLGGWETPGIARFMAALSKPWSLHIVRGDWLLRNHDRISSGTLTELTIDNPYKSDGEIYIRVLVNVCRTFDVPALHTLRWTFDFRRNRKHPHFMHINAGDPTIPRDRFLVLKRVEIHFRCAETQHVWNCSVLKHAFGEYDDLEFMFSVPAADGPKPSSET